jgi:hypothetical protein
MVNEQEVQRVMEETLTQAGSQEEFESQLPDVLGRLGLLTFLGPLVTWRSTYRVAVIQYLGGKNSTIDVSARVNFL